MNNLLPLLPALLLGILLGAIFFAGLWWTIQKGLSAKNPALWFVGSFLLRVAITVSGFYWIAAGSWQKLIACLSGFLIARVALSHFLRTSIPKEKSCRLG